MSEPTNPVSTFVGQSPNDVIDSAEALVSRFGATLIPEITALTDSPQVRIVGEDGTTLVVPYSLVSSLDATLSQASHAGEALLDTRRMEANYPLKFENGADFAAFGGNKHHQGNTIVAAGKDPNEEGTPLLVWKSGIRNHRGSWWGRSEREEDPIAGWTLTVAGANDVVIGFAAWNDKAAILNLANHLNDPQSVIALGGVIEPEAIARLSARLAAQSMKENRSIPRTDLPSMRKILQDAGLASTNTDSRLSEGSLRLLAVKIGGKKIPVAIAIAAPLHPPTVSPDPVAEEQLSYNEKRAAEAARALVVRNDWIAKAKTAVTNAGWRVVDLPNPVSRQWGTQEVCIWVTRLDPNTWTRVAAIARTLAGNIEMSRGGAI